jgi:hypothetical protein
MAKTFKTFCFESIAASTDAVITAERLHADIKEALAIYRVTVSTVTLYTPDIKYITTVSGIEDIETHKLIEEFVTLSLELGQV